MLNGRTTFLIGALLNLLQMRRVLECTSQYANPEFNTILKLERKEGHIKCREHGTTLKCEGRGPQWGRKRTLAVFP